MKFSAPCFGYAKPNQPGSPQIEIKYRDDGIKLRR